LNINLNSVQWYKKLFFCVIALLLASTMVFAHDVPEYPSVPSVDYGSKVFSQRCVLCHGRTGKGDGRMARVIKAPPPADLTASRLPDDYLLDIIVRGSEALGRSKHMPPWGEALQKIEIDSVVIFVKSIRD
jgi:mono/diheme cytochrome c family protein